MNTDSDYFRNLGYDQDPFSDVSVDNLFYTTPELLHRIELIRHLLEFSQQVVFVEGISGSGKTCLKNYLIEHKDLSWSVKTLSLDSSVNKDELEKLLFEYLSNELRIHESDLEKCLGKYIGHCYKTQILPVLIIDNAHNLDIEALELIFQIARTSNQGTYFRIILFCDNRIYDSLEDPRIKVTSSSHIHTISLPAFDIDQTGGYLRYRIEESADSVSFPFSDKDITHIYKASGGNPAKINQLASQALCDPAGQKQDPTSTQATETGSRNSIIKPVLLFLLVCALLIGSYVFVDNLYERKAEPQTVVTLPDPSSTNLKTQPQPVTTHFSDSITTTEPAITAPQDESTSQIVVSNNEVALEIETEPLTQETNVAPEPTNQPAPQVKDDGNVKDKTWYFMQTTESYVLQVLGARDWATISTYLDTIPEHHDALATYTTINNEAPWYVLTYGLYPDRKEAMAQIAQLEIEIKRLQPWAKSIAAIQIEIERHGDE
jgi:DamX protein